MAQLKDFVIQRNVKFKIFKEAWGNADKRVIINEHLVLHKAMKIMVFYTITAEYTGILQLQLKMRGSR